MDNSTVATRFKAMIEQLELSPAQALDLWETMQQAEKSAAAQGIAFKAVADAPPPEVIAALTAAYQAAGDWSPIVAALQQLGQPAGAVTAHLSDTKAARPGPWTAMIRDKDGNRLF